MASIINQTTLIAVCLTVTGTVIAGMCPTCGVELDNKVSQIESKEAIVEERQYIMAEKFGRTLEKLQRDSNTLHTDVQRIKTENNALKDQLGVLDSMKQEYMALGKTVSDLQHRVTLNLNSIRGNIVKSNVALEQEQKIQSSSIERLNNSVKANKVVLDITMGKLAELGRTLLDLENKVENVQNMTGTTETGSSVELEALKGSLKELKEIYGNLQEQQDSQFDALRNSLEEIQKDMKIKEFYPGRK